jgi:hypothetical protein
MEVNRGVNTGGVFMQLLKIQENNRGGGICYTPRIANARASPTCMRRHKEIQSAQDA